MPHRRPRTRAIAQHGDLVVELDPKRPSGRLLRHSGMDSSYVDLADRTHLEFDYMRWLRIVLRASGTKRVLHIGGGACALAQALAAEDPDGRQQVCEVNADVLAMARAHLGLRRAPGLRVRHAEGRAHIAAQPDASWDAVVIDAFVGARVPKRLITAEALADSARVAPLTLINLVDDRAESLVSTVASAMQLAYPEVWTLGQAGGNTVVAGSTRARMPDLGRVAAQAAADPSPARLMTADELAQAIATTPPLRDRPPP